MVCFVLIGRNNTSKSVWWFRACEDFDWLVWLVDRWVHCMVATDWEKGISSSSDGVDGECKREDT